MQIISLNHIALHVSDLAASEDFYRQVLRLKSIARPDFDFPGAWFALGPTQELHLIARAPKDGSQYSPPRERHFALAVADIFQVVTHLDEQGIEFTGPKPRPDNVQQIFLRDPDGHVIELCQLDA